MLFQRPPPAATTSYSVTATSVSTTPRDATGTKHFTDASDENNCSMFGLRSFKLIVIKLCCHHKKILNISTTNVPLSIAANPPVVDADQKICGDKAGIPVPVIAGGVGGLALLIVVIVVVVVLLRRR